jgi:hypothetical protein
MYGECHFAALDPASVPRREPEDRSSCESHDSDSFGHLGRGHTKTVPVAEEKNTLALTLGTLGGLNPLAHAAAGPHGLEESKRASMRFRR